MERHQRSYMWIYAATIFIGAFLLFQVQPLIAKYGVIAVHLSSRYFTLEPVVRQLAEHFGLEAAYFSSPGGALGAFPAKWELLTKNRAFLNAELLRGAARPVPLNQRHVRLWTDDHTNLLPLLALTRR